MTIYRSPEGKQKILSLCDAQLIFRKDAQEKFSKSAHDARIKEKTSILKDRGHMHFLSDGEKRMIVDFLKMDQ